MRAPALVKDFSEATAHPSKSTASILPPVVKLTEAAHNGGNQHGIAHNFITNPMLAHPERMDTFRQVGRLDSNPGKTAECREPLFELRAVDQPLARAKSINGVYFYVPVVLLRPLR